MLLKGWQLWVLLRVSPNISLWQTLDLTVCVKSNQFQLVHPTGKTGNQPNPSHCYYTLCISSRLHGLTHPCPWTELHTIKTTAYGKKKDRNPHTHKTFSEDYMVFSSRCSTNLSAFRQSWHMTPGLSVLSVDNDYLLEFTVWRKAKGKTPQQCFCLLAPRDTVMVWFDYSGKECC